MFSFAFSEFARQLERTGRALIFISRTVSFRAWLFAGFVVVAIAIACIEKWPLQNILGGDGRGSFAFASLIVWRFFDGTWVALLALALFAIGIARKQMRVLETAIALGVAGIVCVLLTKVGQFVFAEARPSEGGAMHFFARGGHGVSGHASGSTVLFFPLFDAARHTSRATRITTTSALIAWPLFVGATRVWLNQHFVWNVLAGFSVGAFAGWIGEKHA